MYEFFGNQIDYILFLYGLGMLMLALICVHLWRRKATELQWIWLGAFSGVHGIQEWLGIFSSGYYSSQSLNGVRVVLSISSFLFLFEFGLRGFFSDRRKLSTMRLAYIPLLLLGLLGGAWGLQEMDASFRYCFGFTGGMLSAAALRKISLQSRGSERKWLTCGSVSMGLYALSAGLVVHKAGFWPASVFNSRNFYDLAGFPIQLAKGVFAICLALSVWAYAQFRIAGVYEEHPAAAQNRSHILMPGLLFIGIVLAGWVLTQFAGNHALSIEMRDANSYISALANHFTSELSSVEQAATGIALEPAVREAVVTGRGDDRERASAVLRQYVRILDASAAAALLYDRRGRVVASSGTGPGEEFRPAHTPAANRCLRQGLAGAFASIYTVDPGSTQRFYVAYYPVRDSSDAVVGVVVIRENLNDIEASFKKHPYCFLVDPQGVIFLSSRDDFHLKSLWPLSPAKQAQLAASGQLGPGPFPALMKGERRHDNLVSLDQQKLLVTQRSLGHDHWSIVLLSATSHIRAYRLFAIFTTLVFFSMSGIFFMIVYFSRDAAAKIAVSERHYRGLVEGSPNCVALFSAEGRCLSVNRSGILQTGLAEDEIVGRQIADVWPDPAQPSAGAMLGHVRQGIRYSYDSERLRRDGRVVMWHAVLNPLYDSGGSVNRFVGIFTDITDRKKAEAELKRYHERLEYLVEDRTRELTDTNRRLQQEVRERIQAEDARRDSEERFHSLFNLASDCILLLDPAGSDGPVIVDANVAASAMNGYSREELIGRPIRSLNFPDDMEKGRESAELLKNGETVTFELRHVRKDGSVFPVEISARMITLGNRPYILAIDRDITERKRVDEELGRHREQLEHLVQERTAELKTAVQLLTNEINFRKSAEETLKESESRFRSLSHEFRTLLDAMTDELLLLTPDLRIRWANKAFAARVGREASALPGEYCYSVWFGYRERCENCYALKSFSTGRPEALPVTTAAGRVFDRRAFPIRDENGNVRNVIIVASDITERTTLQAEAMRAGHLASLGELSAGVAHEINNPITGIINYAQLLVNKSAEGSREFDIAKRIVREGDRIAGIVRSLLSFARERREDKSAVSFEKVLRDSVTLTEAQLKKDGVRLVVRMPEMLPKIWANPQQIQQVVLNVISNARYALNRKYPSAHEDKVLEIVAEETVVDDEPWVSIMFCDHGTGIPSEIIEKAMNPFFTTKPVGEGTGLGLSISHGIIRDHGGRLRLESALGSFTSVIMELPSRRRDG